MKICKSESKSLSSLFVFTFLGNFFSFELSFLKRKPFGLASISQPDILNRKTSNEVINSQHELRHNCHSRKMCIISVVTKNRNQS